MPASNLSFEMEGADEVLVIFAKLEKGMDSPELHAAIQNCAVHGEEKCKEQARKLIYETSESPDYERTQELFRRINADKHVKKVGDGVEAATVSGVYYSAYVEYGTEGPSGQTRMVARPFMKLGAEFALPGISRILADFLKNL